MSLTRPHFSSGWVKSASTTQLNKIGPQKAIPLYNTTVLKEGYLLVRRYKGKATGTIQSKRQRYCVLWVNNFSASLDMYTDETKKKIKRRLSLDRSVEAISLTVKGYKAHTKDSSYLQLRIGADIFELHTNEGVREKKSWCAKLRQAINRDVNMLSGEVVGLVHPNDSPVNIQFSCDCIILTCPFKHTFIKTWKLAFVTSFGQSGNTFTFECCSNCCSEERCTIEADQYTTKCLISSMEAAIMEFPSRSQVVLEKNILGNIYHCSHVCMRRFLESRRASAPPRSRRCHREVTTDTMHTFFSQDNERSGLMNIPSQSSLDLTDRHARDKYLSLIGTQPHTYSSIYSVQPLYSTIEELNKFGSPDYEERSNYSGGDETDQSFGSSTLASSTGDSDVQHLYDQPPNVSIYDIPSDKSKMLWRVQDDHNNNKHSYKVHIPDSDVTYDVPRFRARLASNTSQMLYDTPTSSLKKRWNSVGDALNPDNDIYPTSLRSLHSKIRETEELYFTKQVRPFLSTQV